MAAPTYVTDISEQSADLSTAVLFDLTNWGNSGNPARNTKALFLQLFKRDINNVDTAITIDNSSPLSVTQWNFQLAATDGNYPAVIFGYEIWSAGSYEAGNCVYYSVDGKYYQALSDTSAVPGSDELIWKTLTDPTSIENEENTLVDVGYTMNFNTGHIEIPISDELETLADKIESGKCRDVDQLLKSLKGVALLNGAWVNHWRIKDTQAQAIVDFVTSKYAGLE